MRKFESCLDEARRIVNRVGNFGNRPDMRLVQDLQTVEIVFAIYTVLCTKLSEAKQIAFEAEFRKHLLFLKESAMNSPTNSYRNEFILGIENLLAKIER